MITKDTLTPDSGYLIFSLRSSDVHFDIPIPDPVAVVGGERKAGRAAKDDLVDLFLPWSES
jgi:UPF0288 family protein (methanogenesis marker protein 3)